MDDFQNGIEFANTKNQFMRHNDICITGLSETHATATLLVGPDSLNPLGIVHGGAYFTLLDCLCGALSRVNGRHWVTLNGDIHFIRNVSSGIVSGKAEMIRRGKTICLVEATATDEAGTLLATGRFTMYQKGDRASLPAPE